MHAPPWTAVAVALLVSLATWADVRSRRIPNLLTMPAFLLGILVHLYLGGTSAALNALLGGLVAAAILFPGWMMGFTGAGDVKLMGAVGAWVGYPAGLVATVAALIAGGLFALVAAARKGLLGEVLRNTFSLGFSLLARRAGGPAVPPRNSGVRFPFAPAVLVGALFALFWNG